MNRVLFATNRRLGGMRHGLAHLCGGPAERALFAFENFVTLFFVSSISASNTCSAPGACHRNSPLGRVNRRNSASVPPDLVLFSSHSIRIQHSFFSRVQSRVSCHIRRCTHL